MAKQLRLKVGALTDVGRRRERNQDNVTHFVPTDADLLARRGALFVVCDGMGGHAAGEIASQIGVQTIREVYFQPNDDDVISALARAIRAANTAIFDHARSHASHTGMGTTCVLVALVGGRGFFANIGDSRGYILRNGTLRQVTLDHSWVAEQVRAGVLTEDQARTHAHRNVITRSLGTQPEVTADLFIEEMCEGDRVLLCSDGLHGYVPLDEIQQVVSQADPEAGVHRLIDLANANGGPDNITAVFVDLLEVPPITDELQLPESVKVPHDDVASVDTLILPTGSIEAPGPFGVPAWPLYGRAVASEDLPGARAGMAVAVAAPGAEPGATSLPGTRRTPGTAVALRLLAIAALLVISVGAWDVLAGPYAAQRTTTAQVQRDVATAQSAARATSTESPSAALSALASAQQRLRQDLADLPLDAQGRAEIQQTLDRTVAPAVRSVLQNYNQTNQIVALPASAIQTFAISCGATTFASGPAALVAVDAGVQPSGQPSAAPLLFGMTGQGALYELTLNASTAICGAAALVGQGVRALTSDGAHAYALAQQGLSWVVLEANATGPATLKLTLPPLPSGGAPVALAVRGNDYFIAFQAAQGGAIGGIWHFSGGTATALQKPVQTLLLTAQVGAIGVAASGVPFALLLNGALATWDASGVVALVSVMLAPPVVTSDPTAYAASTPVPTIPSHTATPTGVGGSIAPGATSTTAASATMAPATPTSTGKAAPSSATPAPTATPLPTPQTIPSTQPPGATLFGGGSSLATDRGTATDLVVGDGATPRVIRFAVSGAGLQLIHQYVYGPPLSPLQSVTVSADGTRLFAWSGAQLVEVTLPV